MGSRYVFVVSTYIAAFVGITYTRLPDCLNILECQMDDGKSFQKRLRSSRAFYITREKPWYGEIFPFYFHEPTMLICENREIYVL